MDESAGHHLHSKVLEGQLLGSGKVQRSGPDADVSNGRKSLPRNNRSAA
jgi:hypothetical protein